MLATAAVTLILVNRHRDSILPVWYTMTKGHPVPLMRKQPITPGNLRGVMPVPPLARRSDKQRSLNFAENDKIVRHIAAAGITSLLYGGNAFLYHITLAEYEPLLE